MSEPTNPDDPRRQRLDEVIGAFLVALDAGRNPDPQVWLARHPDLCPELAEFFADRQRLDDVFEPLNAPRSEQADAPAFSITTTQSRSDELSRQPMPGDRDDSAPSDPLSNGTRIRYLGDYELLEVLGKGGWESSTRPAS